MGGTWEGWGNAKITLTCENGRTLTMLSAAVEDAAGSIYLQFMVGDPDGPSFFQEFHRAESVTVPLPRAGADPIC